MHKIMVTFLLVVGLAFSVNAQTRNMAVGAGVVISLPIGDFGDAANIGFGGTGVFEMAFMPQLIGTGTVGYITWGTDADAVDFSVVPILVGAKYFFVPNVGFYGLSQLGLAIFSSSVEIPSFSIGGQTFGGGSESASSTEFSFSIGAGYEHPINEQIALDVSALFNLISNANNIQFRAGAKLAL